MNNGDSISNKCINILIINNSKKVMKNFKLIISMILVLNIGNINATTISQVNIMKLYEKADIVALIRIEFGEVIEGNDFACGANYKGKVIRPLKNTEIDHVIDFGYYMGSAIGEQYIVFLNKKQNVYSPINSTNSSSEQFNYQYNKICKPKHPDYIIMHHGVGIQKLEYQGDTKSDYAFLIPTKFIKLPKHTKLIEPENNTCNRWEKCKWIDKETLLNLLVNKKTK
jgi:hypothetical protein